MAVPRTPKAMAMAISEDTSKYVSEVLGRVGGVGGGRL
jgi:hypothetical protein